METHHARDVRTAARQFEDRGAPEAIADGRDPRRVYLGLAAQLGQRGVHALAEQGAVALVFAGLFPGVRAAGGPNALAIDVSAKRHVAKLRQHLGALLLAITETFPLMHDQHAGTFARVGVIVGQPAFEHGVAVLVGDCLTVNSGAG